MRKRVLIRGGGFAGVETASEINHFVLDASKKYYKNIDLKKLRVILISAREVFYQKLELN